MTIEQELDLYKKAFCLITVWAEECGFGLGCIERWERYQEDKSFKKLGYLEQIMYVVLRESQKMDFSPNTLEKIENVCSEIRK